MPETIEQRCEAKGLRMTGQRRVIAEVLDGSTDHPDVEELHARASGRDPNISIATVYRTVKLFEEAGILEKLEFGDGRARYEDAERDHHDHLIDLQFRRGDRVRATPRSRHCRKRSRASWATASWGTSWNSTACRS